MSNTTDFHTLGYSAASMKILLLEGKHSTPYSTNGQRNAPFHRCSADAVEKKSNIYSRAY